MRIGLFGGTFDPPHRGHLAVARAALERFHLDRVLLAPAGVQPLKPNGADAPFADRLQMVDLLCDGNPELEASQIDAPRPGGEPNYTIDSIRTLHAQLPEGALPFVILGADAFLDIHRWKSPDDLLREARWIIVSRPGFELSALDALGLTAEQRAHIEILPELADPVSATDIRERLRSHESASELVPARVLDYIRKHHLYGT